MCIRDSLDLELASERVEGEGLAGNVVGVTVQVGDELLRACLLYTSSV